MKFLDSEGLIVLIEEIKRSQQPAYNIINDTDFNFDKPKNNHYYFVNIQNDTSCEIHFTNFLEFLTTGNTFKILFHNGGVKNASIIFESNINIKDKPFLEIVGPPVGIKNEYSISPNAYIEFNIQITSIDAGGVVIITKSEELYKL